MATAAQMGAKAASQIGYKESPAGSNKTKYGSWYGMNGEPWCAMFVSWCAAQIGESSAVGKFAYCPYWVDWFKKNGTWLDRSAKPQPGDIIFFSNGKRACHVGIVEKRIDSSYVQTIEGNTSSSSNDNGGAVMRRKRAYGKRGSIWYIMGFGRPKYSGDNMGWKKNDDGWWYQRSDGTYPKSEWEKINGSWYLFNSKGYMLTGWQKVNGKWYYLDSSGKMHTGWLKDDGSWYWLEADGAMCHDGFREIYGRWYGFKHNGRMIDSADQMKVNDNGSIDLG